MSLQTIWFPQEELVASFLVGSQSICTPLYSTSHTHSIANFSEDHPHCEHVEDSDSSYVYWVPNVKPSCCYQQGGRYILNE